jgi:hypothetical protein
MAKTYSDKLQNPLWQRKRLEVLQRDNFCCNTCGNTKRTLHVHHKTYIYGKKPWEYELDNFDTLCNICHELIERLRKEYNVLKKSDVLFIKKRVSSKGTLLYYLYCKQHDEQENRVFFIEEHLATREFRKWFSLSENRLHELSATFKKIIKSQGLKQKKKLN